MKEFGYTIMSLLIIIGLSTVLGIVTRNSEKENKDKDNISNVLFRGLGTVFIIFGIISAIAAVIGVIMLLFGLM